MPRGIGREEYERTFADAAHRALALEHALEIRKFEIELYWQRATYFWTFIAASLAGYGAVQTVSGPAKADPSVTLTCLGLVFAFGWYFANRGSKQWQENWENQVDLLSDKGPGPLYRMVVRRLEPKSVGEIVTRALTGPGNFSVTKINQILSVYVIVLFAALLGYSLLPLNPAAPVKWLYVVEVSSAVLAVICIWALARTSDADHRLRITLRDAKIEDPPKAV